MVKLLRGIVKWVVGLLILGFLLAYLFKNAGRVEWASLRFDPFFLFASMVVLIIDYLMLAGLWGMILEKLGFRLHFFEASRIFFVSLLGRYVPGKAVLVIGRMYLASRKGVGKKAAFTSIIMELFLMSAAGMICFLLALPFFESLPQGVIFIPVIAVPVLLLLLVPRVLGALLNFCLRIFGKEAVAINASYGSILALLTFYVARWVVDGVAFFLLVRSMIDAPVSLVLVLPGIVGLSTVIGIVSFFSPGGLGVRESVMVLLLAPFVGSGMALVVSLVSRVWYTVAEVALAGFFNYCPRFFRRSVRGR